MINHLKPEQLKLLLAGCIPEHEVVVLREHLQVCLACKQLFEEWRVNGAVLPPLRCSDGKDLDGCCDTVQLSDDQDASAELSLPQQSSLGHSVPDYGLLEALPLSISQNASSEHDSHQHEALGLSIPGYSLLKALPRGQGGQGAVYLARQDNPRRVVAIKILLGGRFASDASKHRFDREVELVANLVHPNIVTVYGSGQVDGQLYYSMEYVEGLSLDEYIARGLTLRQKLLLFRDICEGISHAHRHRVIHRDLKPLNIMVDQAGRPRILDFGLAKELACDDLTEEGQLMGTLAYMSPEQTRGMPKEVDTRTDVYSLGVILYRLLTGHAPYETDTTKLQLKDAINNIQEAEPLRPSRVCNHLNSEIDAVVLRAMHKDPDRRYQSAEQLEEDLRALIDGGPVTAKSDSSFYVLKKLACRHYFHTSVITALIASIVGFGGISYHALRRERDLRIHLQRLDKDFTANDHHQQQVAEVALAKRNEQMLGWFLLEWNGGRMESARAIQHLLGAGSPEFLASMFLFDDTMTVDDFRRQMPRGTESLVLFVSGEKSLKKGHVAEAKDAFGAYCSRYTDLWTPLARSRLAEIESRKSGSSIGSGESK